MMAETLQALRTEIAGQAIALRRELASGPLTRVDLARRYVGRGGLTFPQVADLIDGALDGRVHQRPRGEGAEQSTGGGPGHQVHQTANSGSDRGREVVGIGSAKLPVASINGQRVITLTMMDMVHQRPEGTAGRNFREHEAKLIPGEDFLRISADEIRRRNVVELSAKARGEIVLLTESGYLMLVKAFTDPLAWQVQRQMVGIYFRAKDAGGSIATTPQVPIDQGKLIGGVMKSVAGKIVAESEARVLAHTEATLRAELAAMGQRLMAAVRGLCMQGGLDVQMTEHPVGADCLAADSGRIAGLTALAVVRSVLPDAPRARRLAQIASAGLRREADALGHPRARNAAGRYVFPVVVADAWLAAGGSERLLEEPR